MSETKEKLIPTNGNRPEGLKDEDWIWAQTRSGAVFPARVRSLSWISYGYDSDIVAYCLAEPPEPYVPEPDYSKWIGKVCKFWDDSSNIKEYGLLLNVNDTHPMFVSQHGGWSYCRPVTADELVKGATT